jgi:hypothetical protein
LIKAKGVQAMEEADGKNKDLLTTQARATQKRVS